jgi:hypothetical protein
MSIKIGTLFVALLLCFWVQSVFASKTAPEWLQVLEATDVSLKLDWQDVPDAIGYYLYYGTKTASGGKYEIEWIDLISESEFLLESLIPETPYFMAVTSVDELGTESEYSQELRFATLKVGQTSLADVLRISAVNVKSADTLEFLFTQNLDTSAWAVREFIIEDTKTGKEIPVDISDVDSTNPKNVIVVLANKLNLNTNYKVTVLDISDASGKSIESGVDGFINFKTPVSFDIELAVWVDEWIDLNAAPEEEASVTKEDTNIDTIVKEKPTANNAGVTISSWNIPQNDTLQTAQTSTKLPQTWPTQWFLILISLLFGAIIYYTNSKKIALKK